jgi:hypothetical protein
LTPDYCPSNFPTRHRKPATSKSVLRHKRLLERQLKKEDGSRQLPNTAVQSVISTTEKSTQISSDELDCDDYSPGFSIFLFEREDVNTVSTLAKLPLTKSVSVGSDIECFKKVRSSTSQTEKKEPFSVELLRNEEQWSAWTGITEGFFLVLLDFFGPHIKESWSLSAKTKLLIFLIKLKTNLTFSAIASLFGLNRNTVSQVFRNVLDITHEKCHKLLIWPSREMIQARMPKSFQDDFPNCRVIIDATEIECEKPTAVKSQILMYSNYKSTFTVKCLVGIAPSCEVTFLSKCYGGRTTDGQIVSESGFVKLLEPGDQVLADKGFPRIITDVENQGAFIVMPPFKRGQNQFSTDENVEGYKCARVRIHVERVIGRMKTFQILQFLPYNLLPYIDKIMTVIAFIYNNMPDMIKE